MHAAAMMTMMMMIVDGGDMALVHSRGGGMMGRAHSPSLPGRRRRCRCPPARPQPPVDNNDKRVGGMIIIALDVGVLLLINVDRRCSLPPADVLFFWTLLPTYGKSDFLNEKNS
jgi:hypothetical protein